MTDTATTFDPWVSPGPPSARKLPTLVAAQGETFVDNYAWLRERENPDVLRHLQAEDEWAEAVMSPTAKLQSCLYEEMLGRIRETDVNVPWRMGAWLYYSRTEEGKQYPIICRKRDENAEEEILVDLNRLAEGHEYLALGDFEVSDDGTLLAYSLDFSGFRDHVLFIRDLRDGKLLEETIEHVSSVSWAADGRTFFYVTEDEAKRPCRAWRRVVGSGVSELLLEESDELYRMWITRSRSEAYLFLSIASATTSEVRYLEADRPEGEFRVIEPRAEGVEYYVDHRGSRFWILTDDLGKNFRLVNAPVRNPGRCSWDEVLPHRADVKIEEIEIFRGHLVVVERESGLDQFRVIDLESGEQHRIAFPEPIYSAAAGKNRVFETTRFRLAYESFVTPLTIFEYDMKTRKMTLLKETEVVGEFDPGRYVSERLFATAADGTRIPISLVRRRDLDPAGKNPMVLYGYGAYGHALPVVFSSNRLSLLDRGVVYAIAHVRGGGEMGKGWHDAGRMENKRNSFTDFIAVAEHLIATGATARDSLVITGASAGGLLIGAVLNERPELFAGAILHVPFVDVINTMSDPSLPLTVGEYLEWGNPNVEREFRWMRAYDPYLNIRRADYPPMLVHTSFNDSQVMYWEAAKYVARLRDLKTDDIPLLLKVNMAGHGGASGRYDLLREEAFDLAFILERLGMRATCERAEEDLRSA